MFPQAFAPGKVANDLAQKLVLAGGFTYSPFDPAPTAGLALSIYPQRGLQVALTDLDVSTLVDYIEANQDLLADRNTRTYLGGWVDEGQVYLDISVVLPEHKLSYAKWLARHYGQLAIYNLRTGETVTV